jgi:hypothetical protein
MDPAATTERDTLKPQGTVWLAVGVHDERTRISGHIATMQERAC